MQLPRLEITSKLAKLGVHSQNASLEIRQPPAEMTIRQPQPHLTMHKTRSKLEIDQTEAFADANLKSTFRWTRERAQQAKQKLLQDLADEAREGNRLMKIETKNKNTIAQIASEQSKLPQHQINIGFMPETPLKVKFHYTSSELEIKLEPYKPTIRAKMNSPIIKYHPGDFQIYLRQKNFITFSVGEAYDLTM